MARCDNRSATGLRCTDQHDHSGDHYHPDSGSWHGRPLMTKKEIIATILSLGPREDYPGANADHARRLMRKSKSSLTAMLERILKAHALNLSNR